jgi:dihydroorotase
MSDSPITLLPGRVDLLIKSGHVVDPAAGLDAPADIAVAEGRVLAVAPRIEAPGAVDTIDAAGMIVTPGLIDTHAHVYEHVTGDFGLNADLVGVRGGVTCVVDMGGPSAPTWAGFREYVIAASKTRVLAFISTYLAGGLLGHKYVDLYGPSGINVDAIVKTAAANPGMIRGIKAHAEPGGYSRWGLSAVKLAKQASREAGIPVYIHLGTLWPEAGAEPVDPQRVLDEVVPLMDPGDILAHPFTRFPSGFVNKDGSIHPLVYEARARGVTIDVGRGAHFSFDNARAVLGAGILPDTLGADLHGYNIRFPEGGRWYKGMFTDTAELEPPDEEDALPFSTPYGVHHAMSELMALGVSLPDVVRMCTENAAKMLRLSETMGTLAPGRDADISLFQMLDGAWTLRDSLGVEVPATKLLHPVSCVRSGVVYPADSPLLPDLKELAA